MKFSALKLLILLMLIFPSLHAQQDFPGWAEGIVWYQIFPERFADGDTTNEPEAEKVFINSKSVPLDWHIRKWTGDWFKQSDWEKKAGGNINRHLFERRYGGDIQGIINHLDYLKNLGVGAIYLNPIFEAVSLHKYDASTYHHVDINFGPDPEGDKKIIASEIPDDPSTWKWTSADKLFLKLMDEVHKRGMKIIIDGVFNHTGVQFWAFQDIIKNGNDSKFKDWYEITSFDDPSTPQNEFDYKGWAGGKNLPQFNRTENDLMPGPKQYIFYATQRWMDPDKDGDPSDGIDGWRLDVANEVPMGFWHDWNKLVKSINHNAVIIGELWQLSPEYISENGVFDSRMNYNFAFAVNKYFIAEKTKISTSEFIDELKEIDKNYPDKNLYVLQNLVDSHDTERISSMIANPDRNYDRQGNSDNPEYNPGKPSAEDYAKQQLIAAFQMTYRGAPMIYYGDEVGMWGADDPHDRNPMVWDNLKYDDEIVNASSGFKKGWGRYKVEQNKDLLNFYKKIITIHNNNDALKKGDLQFLYSDDKTASFAFERTYEDDKIIAVFNTGKQQAEFNLPLKSKKILFTELLTGEEGSASNDSNGMAKLHINIPPGKFQIYRIYEAKPQD